MSNKGASLKAIAYELGVSINTVSRALRDCSDIGEATKEKVRQKAYLLGYIPNNVTQFVKRDGRKLVALIINNMLNQCFAINSEIIMRLGAEYNFDFTIIYTTEVKVSIDIIKQCISQRVDGIITFVEFDNGAVQTCKLNSIPIVMFGRHQTSDYINEVYSNDEEGSRLAANYLVNYHKAEKLIYIGYKHVDISKRRQKAFTKAAKEENSEVSIVALDVGDIESKLFDLIQSGYYGVFCFNDDLAYRALNSLDRVVVNFRRVYPKFHIIGYDALSNYHCGLIDITSICSNYELMCKDAISIMNRRFANNKGSREVIVYHTSIHQRKVG